MTDNSRPQEILIGESKYYNAEELSKYDPSFFYGCSRTVRNILTKKQLPQIFMYTPHEIKKLIGSFQVIKKNQPQKQVYYFHLIGLLKMFPK